MREPIAAGAKDVEVEEAADEKAALFQLSREGLRICELLQGEKCVGSRVMIILKTGAVCVLASAAL